MLKFCHFHTADTPMPHRQQLRGEPACRCRCHVHWWSLRGFVQTNVLRCCSEVVVTRCKITFVLQLPSSNAHVSSWNHKNTGCGKTSADSAWNIVAISRSKSVGIVFRTIHITILGVMEFGGEHWVSCQANVIDSRALVIIIGPSSKSFRTITCRLKDYN